MPISVLPSTPTHRVTHALDSWYAHITHDTYKYGLHMCIRVISTLSWLPTYTSVYISIYVNAFLY